MCVCVCLSVQQHLEVNAGETKHAINRGKRLLDLQSKAQGYVLVGHTLPVGVCVEVAGGDEGGGWGLHVILAQTVCYNMQKKWCGPHCLQRFSNISIIIHGWVHRGPSYKVHALFWHEN